LNLKTAVGRLEERRFAILRALVASAWRETRRWAQQSTFEKRLEGAREDRAPFLQARQLLRIFSQAS